MGFGVNHCRVRQARDTGRVNKSAKQCLTSAWLASSNTVQCSLLLARELCTPRSAIMTYDPITFWNSGFFTPHPVIVKFSGVGQYDFKHMLLFHDWTGRRDAWASEPSDCARAGMQRLPTCASDVIDSRFLGRHRNAVFVNYQSRGGEGGRKSHWNPFVGPR